MRALVLLLALVLITASKSLRPKSLTKATYSDDFARYAMYPLSMVVYHKDMGPCTATAINGTAKRLVTVHCDDTNKDTCAGYVAWTQSSQAIVLTFRGTTGDNQKAAEIISILKGLVQMPGGGKVANYFYTAFMALWNGGMKDDFLTLWSQYPSYQIWINGHSLGGSMAAVCANYLVATYKIDPNRIRLVTFGQPRTGDQAFANAHDAKFSYSFRVVHNHDLVPQLPFPGMGYKHHSTEIFYPNKMAVGDPYTVCSGQEDHSCSEGQFDDSEADHTDYFNRHDFNKWINNGCKDA